MWVTPADVGIRSAQKSLWGSFLIASGIVKNFANGRCRMNDSSYAGSGRVVINEPSFTDISVSDPVLAPGVSLLAPDLLATHKSLPDTANADN